MMRVTKWANPPGDAKLKKLFPFFGEGVFYFRSGKVGSRLVCVELAVSFPFHFHFLIHPFRAQICADRFLVVGALFGVGILYNKRDF